MGTMKVKQAYKQTLIRCTMSASVDASVCIPCHVYLGAESMEFLYIYIPTPPPHSASCKTSAHLYVWTLVNAWLVEEKHHQYKLR